MDWARWVGLVVLCVAASSPARAESLGSFLGGAPARTQPLDTLRVIPRLAPTVPGTPPAARSAPPAASPTLAIPGTNGRAALGVEPPPATSPGERIIIAPGTIATPPRSTRDQGGSVPAFSITIPSR